MEKKRIEADLIEIQRLEGGGTIIQCPVKVCDIEVYEIQRTNEETKPLEGEEQHAEEH